MSLHLNLFSRSSEKGFLSLVSIFIDNCMFMVRRMKIENKSALLRVTVCIILLILIFPQNMGTMSRRVSNFIANQYRNDCRKIIETVQVCASSGTSIRRNEEKSPVKVHGSRNFHFDFPRAPLSFIKIDALKAVRGRGSLGRVERCHKPVIEVVTSGPGVALKGHGRALAGHVAKSVDVSK